MQRKNMIYKHKELLNNFNKIWKEIQDNIIKRKQKNLKI